MPHAAKHPCRAPNCPELVERGKSYCPEHEKKYLQEYDKQRGTAAERYGPSWSKTSRRKRDLDPMCELCGRVALEVHHIDGDSHNHAWHNLMSICRACHNKIRGKEGR